MGAKIHKLIDISVNLASIFIDFVILCDGNLDRGASSEWLYEGLLKCEVKI